MNTEEKAKAYDEALERARMWRDKSGMPADRQGILDDIFPQLKESEDERIREEIISIVKSYRESYIPEGNYRFEDCIAWLEKQKEPELSEDLGEYITELSKQFPEVSFAKLSRIAVRVKNWLEKQGEQKPWSEEDEVRLQACLDTLQAKSLFGVVDTVMTEWLKSLKQRLKGE